MRTRSMWLGVLLVLLLTVATRLHGAADLPLWTDEGWTVWAIHDHQPSTIISHLQHERHPPLYFLTLSAWWSMLGPSRIMLRLVSIAAGLLTTATLIRTARDWLDDETALMVGVLFAVLDSAIYYTQELRPYSWLILAGTLMSLFFLRYIRTGTQLVAYTLSVIATLYVGYFGVLLLALQGLLWLSVAGWRTRRRVLLAWGAAFVAFLPWLPSTITQFDLIVADEGIRDYPGSYDTTAAEVQQLMQRLFGDQVVWIVLLLYLLGVGFLIYRQRLFMAYLLGSSVGLFVTLLVTNLQIGVVSARTVSFLLPFFLMVSAVGLRSLPTLLRRPGLILLALSCLLSRQEIQPRLASIDAVGVLSRHVRSGDLIILETGADDNVLWYEIQLLDSDVYIIRTLPWVKARATRNAPQPVVPNIRANIGHHDRVWVIQWLQPSQAGPFLANHPDFRQMSHLVSSVGDTYRTRFRDDVIDINLYERSILFDEPLNFGNEILLAGAALPDTLEAGSILHIDLQWEPLQSPVGGYVIQYVLRGPNGRYIAEKVSPPGMLRRDYWFPGYLYEDEHAFDIPSDLPPGRYRVRLSLFPWGTDKPLTVDGEDFGIIGNLEIK